MCVQMCAYSSVDVCIVLWCIVVHRRVFGHNVIVDVCIDVWIGVYMHTNIHAYMHTCMCRGKHACMHTVNPSLLR